ncbi:MAG: VOC family protein [Chloroflexota bacterium]
MPWVGSPVSAERAIRGLAGVTLVVKNLRPTALVLTDVLGFRLVGEYETEGRRSAGYEVGRGGPGAEVRLIERPDLPVHRMVGAGGVHHVAFRTPNDDEHAAWRDRLEKVGLGVTPIIDRFYFHSIYFREPGGILFEIATDGPGFTTDEDPAHLGERLALPPFLEPRRAEIEANLRPITPQPLTPRLPAGRQGLSGEAGAIRCVSLPGPVGPVASARRLSHRVQQRLHGRMGGETAAFFQIWNRRQYVIDEARGDQTRFTLRLHCPFQAALEIVAADTGRL